MKKVLFVALGVVGLAVVGVCGAASMQPDRLELSRGAVYDAAPADVFPYVNDFDGWMKWNPWKDLDKNPQLVFSENKAGVGAWYTWKGETSGSGKMTITESVPNERVGSSLEFIEPFPSKADVMITMALEGEGTKVTWSFTQDLDFMGKMFGLFMDMDAMLGADFEKGLKSLEPLVETDAKARKEAEAAAAAAAAVVDPDAPVDPNAPPVDPAAPQANAP